MGNKRGKNMNINNTDQLLKLFDELIKPIILTLHWTRIAIEIIELGTFACFIMLVAFATSYAVLGSMLMTLWTLAIFHFLSLRYCSLRSAIKSIELFINHTPMHMIEITPIIKAIVIAFIVLFSLSLRLYIFQTLDYL